MNITSSANHQRKSAKNTIDSPKKNRVSYLQNLDNCKDTVRNAPRGGAAVKKNSKDGKRRDNKGRVLQKGESQRPDMLYQYRFTDRQGERRCIYSSDLMVLRQRASEIQFQLARGLNYSAGNVTVREMVDRYLEMLGGKRRSTKETYSFVYTALEHDEFGKRYIRDIKVSDSKQWCIYLSENVYKFGTIQLIKNVVRPAFQMAVDDDLLLKNPFSFKLNFVENDAEKGFAITLEEEKALFEYMKGHKHYHKYCDEYIVLLGTGLRVSELCGLTIPDLNFEERTIRIERQLKVTENGTFYIDPPKTSAGYRTIPMSDEVYQSLQRILANRKRVNMEPNVDGHFGFILLNKRGKPKVARDIERSLRNIRKSYNKTHAVPLPHIVPHTFRHTFCTRLFVNGMDVLSVQYLMGHANAATTLNVYSHVDFEHVQRQFAKVILFRQPEVAVR